MILSVALRMTPSRWSGLEFWPPGYAFLLSPSAKWTLPMRPFSDGLPSGDLSLVPKANSATTSMFGTPSMTRASSFGVPLALDRDQTCRP